MKKKTLSIIAFVLSFIISSAKGDWQFNTFSISDGLPDNTVKCICEDVNGFVWFATKNGIARFDGAHFSILKSVPNGKGSLPENFIYTISSLDSLRMIAGGANASVTIIGSDFSVDASISQVLATQGITASVSAIEKDCDNILWIGTLGDGLVAYSLTDGEITRFSSVSEKQRTISSNKVSDIQIVGNKLFVATESDYVDVIDLITRNVEHRKIMEDHIAFQSFGNKFFFAHDSTLWLSTERNGIFMKPRGVAEFIQHAVSKKLPREYIVSDLALLPDSSLIVSFDGAGLLHLQDDSLHWEKANDFFEKTLPTNAIWTVSVSKKGYLWVGTFANGASFCKTEDNEVTVFSKKTEKGEVLKVNSVLALHRIADSAYLVATDGGGLYQFDAKKMSLSTFFNQKNELRVVKTFCRVGASILCGTYGNGVEIIGESLGAGWAPIFDSLEGKSVWSIAIDKENNAWFGTLYNGIYCKTPDSVLHFLSGKGSHGLAPGMINVLFSDSRGTVWVGLEGGGLMYYKGNHFYSFGKEPHKSVVFSIAESHDGIIYIGYKNHGVDCIRYSNGGSFCIDGTLAEGNTVSSIYPDDNGVWFVAGRSVQFYSNDGVLQSTRNEKDGFFSEIINTNAFTKNKDFVLVGTVSGLNAINVFSGRDGVLPEPKMTGIYFFRNGKREQLFFKDWVWTKTDTIYLKYSDANLKVNVAFEDDVFFGGSCLYRIKGLVDVWTDVGEAKEIALPFLKGGEYILEMQSKYDQKVGGIYRYNLSVENPFWLKKWFIASAVFAIIFMLFVFFAYRDYMHRIQEYKLRKKVEERTRLVSEQNSVLAENTKLLREKNSLLVGQKLELERQKRLLNTSYSELNERNEILVEQRAELENVNSILKKQKEEIKEQALKIGDKNRLLTKSLNYAKRIQDSLFPTVDRLQACLPGSFIFFRPKEIVSGDFFWMKEIGEYIVVAEVDCTGHGVPGAFMSMIGNALLNEIVANKKILSPSEIFYQMNDELVRIFSLGNFDAEAQDDGMDISVAVVDRNANSVAVASAMQNVFVVRKKEAVAYTGDIFSIGGLMARFKSPVYTERKLFMSEGDVLLFASDGFIDQFGGETKEKFGVDRFVQLIQYACANKEGNESAFLLEKFFSWKGDSNQLDDILVVGMRF